MATTGTINSTLLAIYTGSGTPVKITCLTGAQYTIDRDLRETTCKDSGSYADYATAKIHWEMSGEANMAFDSTNGWSALHGTLIAGTLTTVTFQTGVTGDKKYSGTAYLTKLSANSPGTDQNATYSFTFKGVGAITEATI